MMKRIDTYLILAAVMSLCACQDFLEVKPNQKLVVPETTADLRALMDNVFMNANPAIGEGASDNMFLNLADFNSLAQERERNIYLWRNTAADGDAGNWQRSYGNILSANIVLETLAKNAYPNQQEEATQLKGTAHFHRAAQFFNLVLLFAKAYDPATAATDLGIPLRLSSQFEQTNVRSSMADTYRQIEADLKIAIQLLSERSSIATRPNKVAAYALHSRVSLYQADYQQAKLYADSALNLNNQLLDYNSLNVNSTVPFQRFNVETIYYATGSSTLLTPSRSRIAPELFAMYEAQDLRRVLFFTGSSDANRQFKGNYDGQNGSTQFTGLTTAELYLNRAEAWARAGNTNAAMADLNSLLMKRWRTGTFVPFTAPDARTALALVLRERRKELIYRGLRWYDLKRLNKESDFATTLRKTLNGENYELLPNSPAYVFPIPQEVILRGGLIQN
jgi:hypothetical protein